MGSKAVPSLLTAGRIALAAGASLPQVLYVLRTRQHIQPVARAGILRLYDRNALAAVRHEINAIAARRSGAGVRNDV